MTPRRPQGTEVIGMGEGREVAPDDEEITEGEFDFCSRYTLSMSLNKKLFPTFDFFFRR